MIYPPFKKDDVTETIHSREISDPYRWLEDPYSEDTKDFVKKQNMITAPFLSNCIYKKKITEKLTEIWDFPTYSCPVKHGDYFYYFFNSGLQNQSVLYRKRILQDEGVIFMDPNTWSDDGTVSLTFTSFTEDGKYLAYGQSSSGHDWIVVKFFNVATNEHLPDELHRIKFSSARWTHNNKGVFYAGYLEQKGDNDGTETTQNLNQKLRYHVLGTEQSSDVLCHEIIEHPKWLLSSEISDCGRYLLLYIHESCDPNVRVSICDLAAINFNVTGRLEFSDLVDVFRAKYDYVTNKGTKFLFVTNDNAPMMKIVTVDISADTITWTDLIGTDENALINWASCAHHDYLIVCYQINVTDFIWIHSIETGEKMTKLNEDLVSVGGFYCKWNEPKVFYKFTSFGEPGIIYSYDLSLGDAAEKMIINRSTVKGINLDNFISKQEFYPSKDGTKIPMFILRHKDTNLDGSSPCRLYGYGGFDISMKPSFSISFLVLMQHFKFVCAIANIRGGGEYGQSWHNGGRLEKKQNCFDDFIAASEYLIKNKYTNSNKLAIEGGSNGGLLVAACMNQRPDLFGAVIGHVGVLDMLRFHKFTIGHAWVSDYGDPDDPEHFSWIINYSPLHNIKKNTPYPACLLLTADHDDRVVPLHTLKFIAQLQETVGHVSKNPLLVRIDVKSGHGAGKPTTKRIEECADIICFLQLVFQLQWSD